MKRVLLFCLFYFSACVSYPNIENFKGDFFDFASWHVYGQDYEIEKKEIGAVCSAFAIHGGLLEKGTDSLAKAFAESKTNYYAFKILNKKILKVSHITSAKFNEPQAVFLAKNSQSVISFHLMADKKDFVCIGGLNKSLAESFVRSFRKRGFKTQYPCKRLPGVNPENIANLAVKGGVQLEIGSKLMKKLDKSPAKLLKFTEAAREAALGFCY